MNIARTWVFPILRLIIFAIIAVALVKIAFLGGDTAGGSPEFPSGEITQPEVAVTVGTVVNEVIVSGAVKPVTSKAVKATLSGEIVQVHTSQGKKVKKGAAIVTIRAEMPGATKPDGSAGPSWFKTEVVKAGSAGTLSAFTVIKGQMVSVGEEIGRIAPPTFIVSAGLQPEHLYRLIELPEEAMVTITGGPAPFGCGPLRMVSIDSDGEGSGTVNLECTVPSEVTVFTGLQAQVAIPAGIAENVLVVPITAVEGLSGSGNVYVVLDDGSTEMRPVELGLNDGINVEIVSGLSEGDLILLFVPGAFNEGEPGMPGFPEPGIPIEGDGECVEIRPGEFECRG